MIPDGLRDLQKVGNATWLIGWLGFTVSTWKQVKVSWNAVSAI